MEKKRFVMNSGAKLFLRLNRRDGNKVLILGYPTITLQESLENVVGKSLFTTTKQSTRKERGNGNVNFCCRVIFPLFGL